MRLSLLGALGAAVAYGVATVLQAVGARRAASEEAATGVDVGQVADIARQPLYLIGLGCDGLGFLLSFAALQDQPLFLVQACIASSLAVTAVIASRTFDVRLSPAEWAGVAAVCGGLALLGASAASDSTPSTSIALRAGLLAIAVLTAAAGALALRMDGPRAAPFLGLVAGVGFGLGDTCVRVIDRFALGHLLADPATYGAVIGALVGLWAFAVALQRGSVTAATATMTLGETVLPAGFGLLVLGETPRAGGGALALVGFLAAVGGAVALSRFGEAPDPVTSAATAAGADAEA